MGVRKRPVRVDRDPVVQGMFWTALLPGYPYKGQGAFLHFIVVKIGWPLVAGPTTSGLWVPAFSTARFLVIFDTTRIIDAADRYAVYEIETRAQVAIDPRLRTVVDSDILPNVGLHRHRELGDDVLVDIAAVLPSAGKHNWFRWAVESLRGGAPFQRRLAARVESTLSSGRSQRIRRKERAGTIARYNRGYLQWAYRNLRGDPRYANIIASALSKEETRKVKWSQAEQELVVALYRKVFDGPFLERLVDRSIFNRPTDSTGNTMTDDKLEEGFLMNILGLLEVVYGLPSQP